MINGEENYLSCLTGCMDNGKLYVIHRFFPMLLEYDLADFSYRVVSRHVMPERYGRFLVSGMFEMKDKLYITHERCRNIIEYNFATDTYVEHGNYPDVANEIQNRSAVLHEGNIYAFPLFLNEKITRFDIEQNTFMPEIELDKEFQVLCGNDEKLRGRFYLAHDHFFTYANNTNLLFNISLDGSKIEKVTFADDVLIETMEYSGNVFWITSPRDTKVRAWLPEQGIIGEYDVKGIRKNENRALRIWRMISNQDAVLFTAFHGEMQMLSLLDIRTGAEKEIDAAKYCKKTQKNDNVYFNHGLVVGNRVLLLPNTVDSFLWVDMETGEAEPVSCRLRDEDVQIASFMREERRRNVRESEEFSLTNYLHAVSAWDREKR